MIDITLRAMRFHALVGILPHERTTPQPIEIDLHVRVSDGDGVVDYRVLQAIASEIMASGPIDFLEEVGARVVQGALAHSSRIRWARAAVRKPHVALAGPLDYVEVAVEKDANE